MCWFNRCLSSVSYVPDKWYLFIRAANNIVGKRNVNFPLFFFSLQRELSCQLFKNFFWKKQYMLLLLFRIYLFFMFRFLISCSLSYLLLASVEDYLWSNHASVCQWVFNICPAPGTFVGIIKTMKLNHLDS